MVRVLLYITYIHKEPEIFYWDYYNGHIDNGVGEFLKDAAATVAVAATEHLMSLLETVRRTAKRRR